MIGWVFSGSGGSERVMDEWLAGQWILGVLSFQKIFGLCGLKGLVDGRTHGRNVKREIEIWILNLQ